MDRVKHFRNLVRFTYKHRVLGEHATDPRVLLLQAAQTVYVPVPKAANTSTKLALCASLGIDPKTVDQVQKDPRLRMVPFSTIASALSDDCFMFTVVRDPWTRIASAHRDKVVKQHAVLKSLQLMGIEAGESFETFLLALNRWPRKMLNDHFIPQSELLRQPLQIGRMNVYKSEELQDQWPQIASRIAERGAPRPGPIGHHNASGAQSYPEFSSRAQELILKLYDEDFSTFGYDRIPPTA